MSRVHDMGGRFGDGAVIPDAPNAPVFEKDWHARALAVTLAAGSLGQWNLDISRHSRERLSPKDYSRFSYYEKWMAALANLLVEKGVVTRDELQAGHAEGGSPLAERRLLAANVGAALAKGGPADRAGPAPKFQKGDNIRTIHPAANPFVAGGHTRLPSYASGQTGEIRALYGCHIFPDAHAHGRGEDPQPIYAVAFPAQALWGLSADPRDEVILDLWEPYLEPVDG
jgi:nitrile hydratase beta subunit